MQNPILRVMATSTKLCLVVIAVVVGASQSVLVESVKPFIMVRGTPVLGGNLTLTCTISNNSFTNFRVQWFKGDKQVEETGDNTLTLDDLSEQDDGDYSCRVWDNGTGAVTVSSAKALVSVKIPPTVIINEKTVEVYKVPEGKNLTLTCSVRNTPKPVVVASDFSWTVQNLTRRGNKMEVSSQEFNLTDPNEKARNSTPTSSHVLTMSSVTRSQSGRYTCHVNNDPNNTVGIPSTERSIDVQIQYLDKSVNVFPKTSQTVAPGDKVTLTCQADSLPTATLTWLHQGRVLHTVESNEDVYSFTATGCQDSGEYQCRADNKAADKSVYGGTYVTVECPPSPAGHVNLSVVAELPGKVGGHLTLAVNASGNPPPTYTWSGPGSLANKYPANEPSVHLDYLLQEHAGIYTVNVSNKHGSFLQKFKVVVRQHPVQVSEARPFSGASDPNLWLTIVGAVLVVLVILCIIAFVLQKRKELKGNRSRRSQNTRQEASREGESMVPRQHRRRRRPRQDPSARPPNHSHGNHNDHGGHREPPVRVVARFPWHEPDGGNGESSPFVPAPSDSADLPPPDPVVPQQEETGPPAPPFGALAGIPMQIYPWAILPEAESSDSMDELQDKYGLPKNFRSLGPQNHPGTPSDAPPQADDLDPRSANEEEDDLTQQDDRSQTYGTVDVVRGRRPRPSSLARGYAGALAVPELNPAPPKPHFRTLPTWDEVKDEEVVDLDVVPAAPPS